MRKLMIALALSVVAFTFGSMNVLAQTGLTLGSNSSGAVTFSAGGSSMSVGSGIDGSVAGNGALSGVTGTYSITGGPVALTLVSSVPSVFAEYNASGTFGFDVTSGATTLLKGTLSLVQLVQVFSTGVTNPTLDVDLTLTGGTLTLPGEPFSNDLGISQIMLNLSGLGFLPTSSGGGARLSSGTIDPTPEPVSMLLFGSGLLAVGVFARRWHRGSTQTA